MPPLTWHRAGQTHREKKIPVRRMSEPGISRSRTATPADGQDRRLDQLGRVNVFMRVSGESLAARIAYVMVSLEIIPKCPLRSMLPRVVPGAYRGPERADWAFFGSGLRNVHQL